jgi:hypothetical protein
MTPNRYALASIGLGVVLFLGTADFAAANTALFIGPLLKKLAPSASNAQLHATHMVLRKVTHLAEYAQLWFWVIVARLSCVWRARWPTRLTRRSRPRERVVCGDVLIEVSGAAGAVLIACGRPTSRARDQMRSGVAAEPFA